MMDNVEGLNDFTMVQQMWCGCVVSFSSAWNCCMSTGKTDSLQGMLEVARLLQWKENKSLKILTRHRIEL